MKHIDIHWSTAKTLLQKKQIKFSKKATPEVVIQVVGILSIEKHTSCIKNYYILLHLLWIALQTNFSPIKFTLQESNKIPL